MMSGGGAHWHAGRLEALADSLEGEMANPIGCALIAREAAAFLRRQPPLYSLDPATGAVTLHDETHLARAKAIHPPVPGVYSPDQTKPAGPAPLGWPVPGEGG